MLDNSIIKKTGQSWKLVVALVALLAGSIAPAFPETGLSWTAGTIIAIAGYAYGVALIRCPNCGARWFWDALMDPAVYKAVFTGDACPKCQNTVSGRLDKNRE
jgi:hypothetical protein